MDIWGIPGIEAEAELLSAIVHFFKSVGITHQDVGIKVNSRQVLAEVLTKMGVPPDKFAATCVLVDKLEKVPRPNHSVLYLCVCVRASVERERGRERDWSPPHPRA